MGSQLDNTLGALEIGVLIATYLFGTLTLQCQIYYGRFPDDRKLFKALVSCVSGVTPPTSETDTLLSPGRSRLASRTRAHNSSRLRALLGHHYILWRTGEVHAFRGIRSGYSNRRDFDDVGAGAPCSFLPLRTGCNLFV